MRKRENTSKKEYLADALKIPKDMVLGDFKLSMTGNRELYIENYRGIVEYSDKCVILQTKSGYLRMEGEGLVISYYTNEDMKILGIIHSIVFDKE